MSITLSPYGNILLYLLGGVLFLGVLVVLNFLIAPHRPNPEKNTTYECGEDPVGNSNIQLNIRFYIIGLIFLVFDVEVMFLFPWATIFSHVDLLKAVPAWGVYALLEMLIFIGVLLLGLAYVWINGDLAWQKPNPISPSRINPVPDSLYEEVNRRYS